MEPLHVERVPDPSLSLWQSSAYVAAQADVRATDAAAERAAILAHPLIQATARHARVVRHGGAPVAPTDASATVDPAYLSYLHFSLANAKLASSAQQGETQQVEDLETQVRKYSAGDIAGWVTCEENYIYYKVKFGGNTLYTTWQGTPQGLQFSVIDYRLPGNGVVAVLGDWGTGMDDATQLLKTIMTQHRPEAIIHLGDIYYSGTPEGTPSAPAYRGECQENFLDILTNVFNDTLGDGRRIPVFTLPGNHEYYSSGVGYYQEVLPAVNAGIPGALQPASFFCLRTDDDRWQFLGMDTGYNDRDPANQFNSLASAPALRPDEVTWHQDKLDSFTGRTILLSHHQVFSANERLNGRLTGKVPNHNTELESVFKPYFADRVAAWLWGHEHSFVLYQDGLVDLARGRLLGCSSYEEASASNPYTVNYPDVPYLDPTKYQLQATYGYYDHGYAIVELKGGASGSMRLSYYQYPSWAGTNPSPPTTAQLIYSEDIP